MKNRLKQRQESKTCICSICGHTTTNQRGVPCATLRCPKCKIPLTRKV